MQKTDEVYAFFFFAVELYLSSSFGGGGASGREHILLPAQYSVTARLLSF